MLSISWWDSYFLYSLFFSFIYPTNTPFCRLDARHLNIVVAFGVDFRCSKRRVVTFNLGFDTKHFGPIEEVSTLQHFQLQDAVCYFYRHLSFGMHYDVRAYIQVLPAFQSLPASLFTACYSLAISHLNLYCNKEMLVVLLLPQACTHVVSQYWTLHMLLNISVFIGMYTWPSLLTVEFAFHLFLSSYQADFGF